MPRNAPAPSPLEYLLAPLSDDERVELQQILDYLTERSDQPSLPEGSLSAVIANASPNVRSTLETLNQAYGTPRLAPFQPKMSAENYDQSFGFDPQTSAVVRQRLEDEGTVAALQQRMGTDRSRPQEPLTRRDQIAAAFDALSAIDSPSGGE